jgi:hypothetical protein
MPELDGSDLLHQVQSVVVDPLLLDFAAGDLINEDARYGRRIAGRSVAHKLPLMRAASPPASNHPVTFSYLILNRYPQIRQGATVQT